MIFLIPVGTEKKFKKFPLITVVLIALITLIFLFTHFEQKRILKEKGLLLYSAYMLIVEDIQKSENITDLSRMAQILNKSLIQFMNDEYVFANEELQERADQILEELSLLDEKDVYKKFGFNPSKPSLFKSISYAFIHGGWFHLISNMFFMFLFGSFIEDFLGRFKYFIYFLLGSSISAYFHGWITSETLAHVPLVGASGAIAALMSGFLIYFAKHRIKYFFFFLFFFKPIIRLFYVPALYAMPIWFLGEILNHALFKNTSNVAYSAHIGGFVFGFAVNGIIILSPLYKEMKKKYFISSVKENPKSFIDDIEHQLAYNNYEKALEIANEALKIQSEFIPLLKMKVDIHKKLKDDYNVKRSYKQFFSVMSKNNLDFTDDFINAFNDYEYDIAEKSIFSSLIQCFIDKHNYDSAISFSDLFLKELSKKDREHSKVLIKYIVALNISKKFDEALIRVDQGLRTYVDDRDEGIKYIELKKDIFQRVYSEYGNLVIDDIFTLDSYRFEKKQKEFGELFLKLEQKDIFFTFEQYLYRSEQFDVKKEYKKIVETYKLILDKYPDHPLIYIVYYRMGNLVELIKKDGNAAIKYYTTAASKCNDAAHQQKIYDNIKRIERGTQYM